jgi:hypothetical protein
VGVPEEDACGRRNSAEEVPEEEGNELEVRGEVLYLGFVLRPLEWLRKKSGECLRKT